MTVKTTYDVEIDTRRNDDDEWLVMHSDLSLDDAKTLMYDARAEYAADARIVEHVIVSHVVQNVQYEYDKRNTYERTI